MKIIYLMLALSIVWHIASGQAPTNTDMPKVIPPSPKAQTFDLFGNYSVTPNTGAPDISIPLYTIQSGKLQLPIALRYHIGAIKPGYDHSETGFGWVLDIGGQISRTIMNGPDDASPRLASTYFHSDLDQSVWANAQQFDYCTKGQVDSEYDIFNYSFPGQGGEFIIDKDIAGAYQAHLLSYKPLKFQFLTETSPYSPTTQLLSTINLTNANGDTYKFGDGAVESCLNSESYYAHTTWKLKKITSVDKADAINFNYNMVAAYPLVAQVSSQSISMDMVKDFWFRSTPLTFPTVAPSMDCAIIPHAITTYEETTVKEIAFNNGKIVFDLSTDNTKINAMSVFDNQDNLIKKIVFYRNSNSTNNHLSLDSLHIYDAPLSQNQTYKFEYDPNKMAVDGTWGYSTDYWGYNNNKAPWCTDRSYDYLDCTNVNVQFPVHVSALGIYNREPDYSAAQAEILKKIVFPTKGETEFVYEGNTYLQGGSTINGGGLRINSTIDRDGLGNEVKKTYTYEGGFVEHSVTNEDNFTTTTYKVVAQGQDGGFNDYWVYRNRNFSNTISGDLGDNRVNYTKVSEILGASSTNNVGKIVYYYQYTNPNYYGIYDPGIDGAVGRTILYDHRNWDNGLLYRKDILKINPDHSFQPVSTERNYYSYGSGDIFYNLKLSRLTYLTGSTVQDDFDVLASMVSGTIPPPAAYKLFSAYDYRITTGRTHLDKTINTSYFKNGAVMDSIVTQSRNFYSNAIHDQITQKTAHTSTGDSLITQYKYPHDFVSTSPYTLMVDSSHIWSPVIEQLDYKNIVDGSHFLQSTKTDYSIWNSNNAQIYPASVSAKRLSGSYETRLNYLAYDDEGNLKSVSKVSGPKINYVYSYGGTFPIAQITNADYSTVETLLGGSTAVQAFRNINYPTDAEVNTFLAPLRVISNLPNSQVSTYTYKPLVGMSSMTDARGNTTYYEYDSFQRLMNVKDQHGNIKTHYCYNYAGQTTDCSTLLYYSAAQSVSLTRQCSGSTTGSLITYTVPAGQYTSAISQADADIKATADITANGQAYANAHGTCTVCTGNEYKIINNVCQQGAKVYTASSQVDDHWVCTFHYEWTDGTHSTDYTENSSGACAF